MSEAGQIQIPRLSRAFSQYTSIVQNGNIELVKVQLAKLFEEVHNWGLYGEDALELIVENCSNFHLQNLDSTGFTNFYKFAFQLCKDPSRKSLQVDRAVRLWQVLLQGRFRLLDRWCSFVANCSGKEVVSEDTWRQLLDFSRCILEDLSNYDPHGAWPVLIDEFVDAFRGGRSQPRPSECEGANRSGPATWRYAPASHVFCTPPPSMAVSPSAGSKRRCPDVETITQQLSHLPLAPGEGAGHQNAKKYCLRTPTWSMGNVS